MTRRRFGSRAGSLGGYVLAAVLLWLFARNVEWRALVEAARSAGWSIIALAIVIRFASLAVSALRWQALLEPTQHVPFRGVLAATMIGVTASVVAPVQAAELIRPYVLSRRERVNLTATLGTAIAEWVLDAVAVIALFVAAVLWQRAGNGAPARAPMTATLFFPALVTTCLALLRLAAGRAAHFDAPSSASAPSSDIRGRTVRALRSFALGLGALRQRRGLLIVTGYSLALSALTATSAWLTLIAFQVIRRPQVGQYLIAFQMPISFAAGFLLLGLITIAGIVPTPGAVGGFHAICQLGLVAFFHIDRAHTVLPVIVLHAVLYMPAALVGVLCFTTSPGQVEWVEP